MPQFTLALALHDCSNRQLFLLLAYRETCRWLGHDCQALQTRMHFPALTPLCMPIILGFYGAALSRPFAASVLLGHKYLVDLSMGRKLIAPCFHLAA